MSCRQQGQSRRNLVGTARGCRTHEGQLPLGVHVDRHVTKPSDSPDHTEVDVVFLRTILQLLVLATLAVGAITVNIAIHLSPEDEQLTSVANLTSPISSGRVTGAKLASQW